MKRSDTARYTSWCQYLINLQPEISFINHFRTSCYTWRCTNCLYNVKYLHFSGLFQSPLLPSISGFHNSTAAAAAAVIRASVGATIPTVTVAPSVLGGVSVPTSVFVNVSSPHTVLGAVHPPSLVPSSVSQLLVQSRVLPHPPSSPPPQQPPRPHSSNSPSHKVEREGLRLVVRDNRDSEGRGDREGSIPSPPNSQGELSHPGGSTSPLMLTPVLMESQIQRIADTACALVKSLPDLEPKQPNAKKKICKELEVSKDVINKFIFGISIFSKLFSSNFRISKNWSLQTFKHLNKV